MSTDLLLGPMGTPLDDAARLGLADADAATCMEQVRWARHAAIVTPTGGLVRAVDTGHEPAPKPDVPGLGVLPTICAVCHDDYPCPSARMEWEAMA